MNQIQGDAMRRIMSDSRRLSEAFQGSFRGVNRSIRWLQRLPLVLQELTERQNTFQEIFAGFQGASGVFLRAS